MTSLTIRLEKAARLLSERLAALEERLQDSDTAMWAEYRETAKALAQVCAHVAPGQRGELMTTREMAEKLQISSKTLLKRKARGEVRPALVLGRRGRAAIRWRGDEVGR